MTIRNSIIGRVPDDRTPNSARPKNVGAIGPPKKAGGPVGAGPVGNESNCEPNHSEFLNDSIAQRREGESPTRLTPRPLTGPARVLRAVTDSELTSTERMVCIALVSLGEWKTWDGDCWASVASIAKAAGIHAGTAQKTLSRLQMVGVVNVLSGSCGGRDATGRGLTTRRCLDLELLEALNAGAAPGLKASAAPGLNNRNPRAARDELGRHAPPTQAPDTMIPGAALPSHEYQEHSTTTMNGGGGIAARADLNHADGTAILQAMTATESSGAVANLWTAPSGPASQSAGAAAVEGRLIEAGVSRAKAHELASIHSVAEVEEAIRITARKSGVREPAGLIVHILENEVARGELAKRTAVSGAPDRATATRDRLAGLKAEAERQREADGQKHALELQCWAAVPGPAKQEALAAYRARTSVCRSWDDARIIKRALPDLLVLVGIDGGATRPEPPVTATVRQSQDQLFDSQNPEPETRSEHKNGSSQ